MPRGVPAWRHQTVQQSFSSEEAFLDSLATLGDRANIRLKTPSQLLVSRDGLLGGRYSFDLATIPMLVTWAVPAAAGFVNALWAKGRRELAIATMNMLFRYGWKSLKGRYLVVERQTRRALCLSCNPLSADLVDRWKPLCETMAAQGAVFVEGGAVNDEVYARYRLPESMGQLVADGREYMHYPGWHLMGRLVRREPPSTLPLVARDDGLTFVIRGRRASGARGARGCIAKPFDEFPDYAGIMQKLVEAANRPLGLSTAALLQQSQQMLCSIHAIREGLMRASVKGAEVFSTAGEALKQAPFDLQQVVTASAYACLCQVVHAARTAMLRWRENTEAVMLGWIRFGKCMRASEMR